MRFLLLLLVVGHAAAQQIAVINRDEIEYEQSTPCPITYVEPDNPRPALLDRLSDGYKICKKGNIANCPQGSTFYMDERRLGKCQFCTCDRQQGGLWTAHCNKIKCDTLPKSTPTPGNGALKGHKVRYNCPRTKPKVCPAGCKYLARYRTCVYCDCSEGNKVDFTKEEYRI